MNLVNRKYEALSRGLFAFSDCYSFELNQKCVIAELKFVVNISFSENSYVSNYSEAYRYTFNGKEQDAETDLQDYGFRIYNPALGKFLSVDPLTDKYPMLTPYQFASNSPIWCIDLDGLEGMPTTNTYNATEATIESLNQQGFHVNFTSATNVMNMRKQQENGHLVGYHGNERWDYYFIVTGSRNITNTDGTVSIINEGYYAYTVSYQEQISVYDPGSPPVPAIPEQPEVWEWQDEPVVYDQIDGDVTQNQDPTFESWASDASTVAHWVNNEILAINSMSYVTPTKKVKYEIWAIDITFKTYSSPTDPLKWQGSTVDRQITSPQPRYYSDPLLNTPDPNDKHFLATYSIHTAKYTSNYSKIKDRVPGSDFIPGIEPRWRIVNGPWRPKSY